jgi:peptide deformylase
MPVRPIVLYDDPLLRQKSRRVRRVTPDLQRLVDDMVETMHAADGLGLSAIQIGVPERVIVVQLPQDEENPDAGEL